MKTVVQECDIESAVTDVTGAQPPGGALLDDVEAFLGRFVIYPSDAERAAHALWVAHTWFMESWDSTPRIAFLSPEPGSGKSRALEVTNPLVPRAVETINVSPAYLFRRMAAEGGIPTILFDEVDTIFGPKAGDSHEELRGLINGGHRKGATVGRCVTVGNTITTEDFPSYCAIALAGLDDLPDTVMSRAVVVRMRRRSPNEKVEPWRLRINGPEGEQLAKRLDEWSTLERGNIVWPQMPDAIQDRNADVWEALLAVADLAGGSWPIRAREVALKMVSSSGRGMTVGVMLLRDLRVIFTDELQLTTVEIVNRLLQLEESPWSDLKGEQIDALVLSRMLSKYDVHPTRIRVGGIQGRGYKAAHLTDSWSRYLPPQGPVTVTPVTHDSGCDCPNGQYDQHRLDCPEMDAR